MIIAIDWDVKNQTKPKNRCCVLELDPLSGRCNIYKIDFFFAVSSTCSQAENLDI